LLLAEMRPVSGCEAAKMTCRSGGEEVKAREAVQKEAMRELAMFNAAAAAYWKARAERPDLPPGVVARENDPLEKDLNTRGHGLTSRTRYIDFGTQEKARAIIERARAELSKRYKLDGCMWVEGLLEDLIADALSDAKGEP
jgi:hypothetical protein